MHSHDRTLLARLGFADPDKRDRRHDLACRYVGQDEQHRKIAEMFLDRRRYEEPCFIEQSGLAVPRGMRVFGGTVQPETVHSLEPPNFEVPLSKGEGPYKTTIGFLDVVLRHRADVKCIGYWRASKDDAPNPGSGAEAVIDWNTRTVCVEVKIAPIGAAEILRQINLYRQYVGPSHRHWLVVTAFGVSDGDREMLATAGVRHLRLGDAFAEWSAQMSERPGTGGDEI